jgi:hypothetical protein
MKRIIPFLMLAFVVAACEDDGPTVPVGGPQFGKGPKCENPPCKEEPGPVVASARGDHLIVLPDRDRWIHFWAEEYADGSVAGEYRLEQLWSGDKKPKSKGLGRGEITCFAISDDGDEAWFGARSRTDHPGQDQIVWRVDRAPDPDRSTLACPGLPNYPELDPDHECYGLGGFTADDYCAARPVDMPTLAPYRRQIVPPDEERHHQHRDYGNQ